MRSLMVRLACRPAVANQLEENKVYRHEIVCAESVNEVEAAGSMDNLDGPIRSRFRGLSWDKKHQVRHHEAWTYTTGKL